MRIGRCSCSSTGGGREVLVIDVVEERLEGILRRIGDRGGVAPVPPCIELREVRLRNVGVKDRSFDPVELEVVVLWKGAGDARFMRSAEF